MICGPSCGQYIFEGGTACHVALSTRHKSACLTSMDKYELLLNINMGVYMFRPNGRQCVANKIIVLANLGDLLLVTFRLERLVNVLRRKISGMGSKADD